MLWGLLALASLALVPRLAAAQGFVEPPPADGISTSAATINYTLSAPADVAWDSNFTNLNLLLVSEHRATAGSHLAPAWNATLLSNTTSSNASVHFPLNTPLDHDGRFHLLAVEIDADSGNETGNWFASAVFDLRNAPPSASTTLPPSWPSTTSTTSPSASASAASSQSPSVVGISLGLILGVAAIAGVITACIWLQNRRRHRRYAALVAGPNEAGIAVTSDAQVQSPLPSQVASPAVPMAMAAAAAPISTPARASISPRRASNKPLPLVIASMAPSSPASPASPLSHRSAGPSPRPARGSAASSASPTAYASLRRGSAVSAAYGHRASAGVSPPSSARRSAAPPSSVSPLSSRRPSALSSHPPASSRYSVRSSASFEDMRPPTPPPKTWTPLGRSS